jgi:type II secretory pathway component GspD/PulD (secretin)
MKILKLLPVLLFILIIQLPVQGQTIRAMDFRNQNIADILMVLADAGNQSIIVDESVLGTATFHFSDSSFEDALYRFTDACNLYVEKRNNAYYVSRIRISRVPQPNPQGEGSPLEGDLVNVNTENVDIEMLVRALSRNLGRTIIYDQLPRAVISINSEKASLTDLLEIIIKKYPEYSITEENNAFYIKRAADQSYNTAGRLGSNSITERNNLFSMNIQRASFSSILSLLFKTGNREYTLLQRIDTSIDNLYFQDKPFDQLLRLVLEQANCDFIEVDSIYYIFEVQRRDILKKLKNVIVIQLQHIPVESAVALLPNEYSASSYMKTDRNSNSVYLTGSAEEITPIADFFAMIDVPGKNKSFKRYEIQFLPVKDFIALLPQELSRTSPLVIPDSNSFISHITEEQEEQFEQFIRLVDRRNAGFPIHLRYIKNDELLQFLPPSVTKDELVTSADPTLVFYKGTSEKQKQFMEHLKLIDQPKPQIRYQLLVIQYQRSDNTTWTKGLSVTSDVNKAAPGFDMPKMIVGNFSNLLNINFDIVTEFGYQFAANLNLQIGEDKAKILADTTLNGISGQDIKFENTTTFRYRDTTIDPETGKPLYTGVTREITSGLVLNINGWVSGDGMITMKVEAAVSKQDESGANVSATTNPPPTSERVVNTQVRTKSGTPIVIGGLLQVEKVGNVKKVPLLGDIPLLGKLFQDIVIQDNTTEMVIYVVPYIHNSNEQAANYVKRNEEYLKKYVLKDGK